MNEQQKVQYKGKLLEALRTRQQEMGPVLLTHKMTRLYLGADGKPVEQPVILSVDVPKEHIMTEGRTLWTCNVHISLLPKHYPATGSSSLNAVIQAVYLAAKLLNALPFATEIDMSLLPNFGLPVSPFTSPEELATEQNRPKSYKPATLSAKTGSLVHETRPVEGREETRIH